MRRRKSVRLKDYDYSEPGYYFVTVCVQNRKCLFGEIAVGAGPCACPEMVLNDRGRMVHSAWEQMPAHYPGVFLDSFVIMPNHFHGIVGLNLDTGQPRGVAPTPMSLPDVIHRFKSFTTAQYRNGVKQHRWPPFPGKLWQRNYYERVIRNENELFEIRQYVQENPLKWDLDPENPNRAGAIHESPLHSV